MFLITKELGWVEVLGEGFFFFFGQCAYWSNASMKLMLRSTSVHIVNRYWYRLEKLVNLHKNRLIYLCQR